MEFTNDSLNSHTETSTTHSQEQASDAVRQFTPGLVIVGHPDASRVGEEAPLVGLLAGKSMSLSRREPRFLPPAEDIAPRSLRYKGLSRRPLLLTPGPAPGEITLRRNESPIALQIGGETLIDRRTFSAKEIEQGVVLVLADRVALLLQPMPVMPVSTPSDFGLVGSSYAMTKLRREIQAAALLKVPVLVRGETGSGKELVARGVHDARAHGGPYLAVNFGAMVPALAASELFGATRGAYTGADRHREGLFRRADGGTLFLDEIGEAPVEVQVMLLRTLESGRVQAIGGTEERAVDVRVIAATDADLDAAIAAGGFRAALLHRLAGYEIRVPPLRERRDDIARLLFYFLHEEFRALNTATLGEDTPSWPAAKIIARLVTHNWPGNVRELKNVARRLAALRHTEGNVDSEPLLDQLLRPPEESYPADEAPSPKPLAPMHPGRRRGADVEPTEMLEVLAQHDWCPRPAAKALGISRPALYRLINAHPDLRTASDYGRDEILTAVAHHGSIPLAARALKVSAMGLRRRLRVLGLDPEKL